MHLLVISLPLALLLVATVFDLRTREVPDWISIAILCWGIVATTFGLHELNWIGLSLGVLVGFALGSVVFYFGGLGGADVKLIAAMGAVLGPIALLIVLFWMAMAGAVLALVSAARGKRDFAYVPAITAGLIAYMIYPGGLWHEVFPS